MPMEIVRQLPYDHPYRWDGTLFGGPKLWRPNALAGSLALWLDAEDTASITLNGTTVSQWADKSGNGRHVTQSTASEQPTLLASAIGGKPALNFDGVNDFLLGVNNIGLSGNPQFSLLAVQTAVLLPAFSVYFSFGSAPAGQGFHWLSSFDDTKIAVGYASSTQVVDASFTSTSTPFIAGINRNGNLGSNWLIRQNGAGVSITSGNNNAVSLVNGPINIGRWVAGANFSAMNLGEIILIPTSVDDATMQRLEGYLAWKWGLEANLPSNHPYKLLPPTV